MDDSLLVGQAVAGDLESFGQLYDQFLPRVYDFAWRTLGDEAEAADVTRDVFLQAARRLSHGTAGASFRQWLFAIAFKLVLARADRLGSNAPATGPRYEEAFGSFAVPDPARVADPALIGDDHELAALVWEAASSLTPRDRAILDLHLRQGLDSVELAAILGINKRDAANLVARMKAAAADVIASYVIARRGGSMCDRLQEVLAPFDLPPYTDAARHAVDTHIKDCATCTAARARIAPPLEVFGAFVAAEAPSALKGDIWSAIAAGWTARPLTIADLEAPTAPLDAVGPSGLLSLGGAGMSGGYPPPGAGSWDRRQIIWFGGAAAGLILFAFIVGFVAVNVLGAGGNSPSGGAVAASPSPSDTPLASSSITPGVAILTPTPNLTPSVTPPATATPTPAPPTATPTLAPAPPSPTRTPAGTATKPPAGTPTPTRTPGGPTPVPTPTVPVTPTP
ncbi:MAG TPA: sigma-70 family RNA polymerase sigma factor [Dehalococcoidia bacterium]|nr:sigma-70 family RNA polymerase sigma factor [Dehalococcoidia bacterium]